LKDEIESQKNFYKKAKKKIEIKRIRIKFEIIIYDKLRLNDEIESNLNFYKITKNKNKK
jgi:hypothetical protein